jgi:hypothetical protein
LKEEDVEGKRREKSFRRGMGGEDKEEW